MGFIVYLLYIVQHILFMRGILQTKLHRSWFRVVISIVVLMLAKVMHAYCVYYRGKIDLLYLVGVFVMPTIGAILLFDDPLVKKVVKYWFAVVYIDVFYMPINTLITGICDVLEPNVNYNLAVIIETIMVLGAVWGVSYLLKENKRIVEWIKKAPTVYFVIAILCGGTAAGIGSYLEFMGKDE